MKHPKISIVIPTRNSRQFLDDCLGSIYKQDYPKEKIEVFVVDGGSTDNTVEIAKKYKVNILDNPEKLAEPAKVIGYKHSTGDLYFYLDSDAELVSKTWLKDMVFPLNDDKELVGSFTRYVSKKGQSAYNRYLDFNPLELWSMLSFLLPSIRDVTIEKKDKYDVVRINPDNAPPLGICLYRKKILDKVIRDPDKYNYVDIAIPLQLAEIGYDKLAYVERAGIYHARSGIGGRGFKREFHRQRRDVTVTYLPVIGKRKFNYIDYKNPLDILKVFGWVVYVNLIIPSLLVGIYKCIKHKDIAGMYELPVNLLLTNYIIYLFLSDPKGRRLIRNVVLGKA
jgi:glycosyltransferase involved in cell wall biosynthesis